MSSWKHEGDTRLETCKDRVDTRLKVHRSYGRKFDCSQSHHQINNTVIIQLSMKRDLGLGKVAIKSDRVDIWRASETSKEPNVQRNFTQSAGQSNEINVIESVEFTRNQLL